MSNPTRCSFPSNIVLPRWLAFINQIQNPLALQKTVDRCLGFIVWDFDTKLSYAKLIFVVIMYIYLVVCCVCALFLVNPADVHPDYYLKMWFFIGAGASCSLPWIALLPARRHFATIHEFLTDQYRLDPYHPLRYRSRPVIFLCSVFFFSINTSISVFWCILLQGSCPITFAFRYPGVEPASSLVYLVECFHLGMTANGTMVTTLTTLLSFIVEFDVLGVELRESFSTMDVDVIRRSVERHQQLLELVNLFRAKIKPYFLIAMGLYLFLVTFSCFLLVVQLREGDFQALRFNVFNAAISIVTIIMFGVICDMVEDRVRRIGDQVYESEWPLKLVYDQGRGDVYRLQKSSLMMVIARSQKKVGFTCGDIYQMSTITSMQVLKLCYTAFTMLWNATNE
ncbi:uncharacterized protein LOC5577939 [Aedes aegypti]|uniref:Odorant receptor n=1 Tax=Aedes aegypti TaxID=7159 RepID=A0A1S4FZ07_AEDAE|nr:odorant receptor 79 [Aedes aegypti]